MSLIFARLDDRRSESERTADRKSADRELIAATEDLARATRRVERAICASRRAGDTERGIERVTGISRPRIHRIIAEAPDRDDRPEAGASTTAAQG